MNTQLRYNVAERETIIVGDPIPLTLEDQLALVQMDNAQLKSDVDQLKRDVETLMQVANSQP